jgi:JAB1/Mov34/MPN/PAD-1 ubiquitin protease
VDHPVQSIAWGSPGCIVGVLLGQDHGRSINMANSFGVPFEEDDKDTKTWSLDHNYVESMFDVFKKVNGSSHPCNHFFMEEDLTGRCKLTLHSKGTQDRVVPYRSETSSVRLGDQRVDQGNLLHNQ